MDELDTRILRELDRDCRVTYEAISRVVGISANSVKKRIDRMAEIGTIVRYMIGLRDDAVGSQHVYAFIRTTGTENPDLLIQSIGATGTFAHVARIATDTGGLYFAIGQYMGVEDLMRLSHEMRKMNSVTDVDVHLTDFEAERLAKKTDFKRMHYRVLRCLLQDPRMTVSQISRRTGLTARRVSSLLDEIQESGAFSLSVRWNLSEQQTEFFVIIHYDSADATIQQIDAWIKENYPHEFWYSLHSASKPMTTVNFIADSPKRAGIVSDGIRRQPFVTKADTLMVLSETKFPWPSERYLAKMLDEHP